MSDALTLPVNVTFSVALGSVNVKSDFCGYIACTLSLTIAPVSGSAYHPITLHPPDVTRAPLVSILKSPALVKYVLPALLIIKNELPERHTSHVLSVRSVAPCEVIAVDIDATVDPRPICLALVPPLLPSLLGPDAVCVV